MKIPQFQLAFAFVLAFFSQASAHTLEHAKSIQLRFDASGATAHIVYGVQPGPDAAGVRTDFDADGDGVLSQAEQEALTRRLTTMATFALRVERDGVLVTGDPPVLVAVHGLARKVRSGSDLHVSLLIRYTIRWNDPITTIHVSDRHPDLRFKVWLEVDPGPLEVEPIHRGTLRRSVPLALRVARPAEMNRSEKKEEEQKK